MSTYFISLPDYYSPATYSCRCCGRRNNSNKPKHERQLVVDGKTFGAICSACVEIIEDSGLEGLQRRLRRRAWLRRAQAKRAIRVADQLDVSARVLIEKEVFEECPF